MKSEKRQEILKKIRSNVLTHGYHLRIVDGGPLPRFAYTIGLHERCGWELVFGGGAYFAIDDLKQIVKCFAEPAISQKSMPPSWVVLEALGTFTLSEADPSWANKMLLGALDYYGLDEIKALQIRPDQNHWTIDVPNLQEPWSSVSQPIWKWLEIDWDYSISARSVGITNLDALRGKPITEVTRWEEAEWELFSGAGPDVEKSDLRKIPLAVLLEQDPTLKCIAELEIGAGLWRESKDLEWHLWE